LQESYEKLRQILGLNWEVSKIGPLLGQNHGLPRENLGSARAVFYRPNTN